MKLTRPFLVLALSASAALWLRAADDNGVLPKSLPAARYDAMAARSPFTAPTAAVAPTPPPVTTGPHWWDQMSLTSLMDRGGVYYIGLVDKASNRHYLLATGKTDEDSQLLLNEVHWNDHLDQVTATISKGAETAPPIRFDSSGAPAATASTAAVQPSMSVPRPLPNGMPPTLPPGFSGTPPPPPPGMGNLVVHRPNPIPARPLANPQQGASRQPVGNGPRRIIVPSSSDDNN